MIVKSFREERIGHVNDAIRALCRNKVSVFGTHERWSCFLS